MSQRILIAYFSASGATARAAKEMTQAVGAERYEIRTVQPYTSADLNWTDKKSRSSVEMNDPASRPAIAEPVEGMEQYDTVMVGFPIWWYVEPRIVDTFLESYDFSGKTIVPFCTSGGSGAGKTDQVLHALCPDSVDWRPCKLLNGRPSAAQLKKWADSLHLG